MKQDFIERVEKRSTELIVIAAAVILIGSVVQAQTGVLSAGSSSGSGLIAEYRFDTGAGEIAYDTAGDNDGTINGAGWASGLQGGAMKFDGSSSVSLESSSDLPSGSEAFTLSTWIKVPADCSTRGGVFGYGNWGSGDQTNALRTDSNCESLRHYFWGNDLSTGDIGINDGRWHHVAVTYDGSSVREIFVDGRQVASDNPGSVNMQVQDVNIGVTNGDEYFEGKTDNLNIYSDDLDSSQVLSVYNSGSWKVKDAKGKDDPDKVLDLSFQHQNSSHVYDTSGYENHGRSLNGASQKNSVNCKVGRCYSFDGNNDFVPIQGSYTTMPEGATVMAWIKTTSQGIVLSYDRSEIFRFGNEGGAVSWDTANSADGVNDMTGNTNVADGEWHHIAATYNPDTASKRIYVDGRLDAKENWSGSQLGTGTTRYGFVSRGSEANTFNGATGPNSWFEGRIDELKFFNRSLSQQEIIKESDRLESNGAVLDMRFNSEGGDKIYDYSGEENHGLTGDSPNRVSGVTGNSIQLSGEDEVKVTDDPSLHVNDHTISFWIKQTSDLDSQYNTIFQNGDGSTADDGTGGRLPQIYFHQRGDGSLHWRWSTNTTGNDGLDTPPGTVTKGEWIHLVGIKKGDNYAVYKNGKLLDQVQLSSSGAGTGYGGITLRGDSRNSVDFRLDSLKFYPYATEESTVERLHSLGRSKVGGSKQNSDIDLEKDLILSQSFDRIETCGQSDTISCPSGMSGEIAVDESGSANYGELINDPAKKSSENCVRGRCLSFDGNDDYLKVDETQNLNFTSPITFSTWVKMNSDVSDYRGYPVVQRDGGTRNSGVWINNQGEIGVLSWNSPQSVYAGNIADGQWHHFAGVIDNGQARVYLDGQLQDSGEIGQITYDGSSDIYLGARGDGSGGSVYNINGDLDQIKVYNRTLSDKEVWKLYTTGRDRSSGDVGASSSWEMNTPGYGVGDSSGENDGTLKPNLLDNSGFESGSDNAGNMNRIVTNYAGNSRIVTEESKSGWYSGKHIKTGEDDQWSAVTWDLTSLEAGKTYDFGVWYKCTGNVESADFDVGIANGTDWNRVGYIDLGEYKCDDTWHFASGESPELPSGMQNTNRVRFTWGYSTTPGTMNIDDMYMREDDADWAVSNEKGRVLEFDGSQDYIQLEEPAVMEKEGSTLVWSMNPDGTSNTGLFSNDPSGLDNHIQVRSDRIRSETQQNCNNFDFAQYEKETGWGTYAIVFESSNAYLYENGEMLGEATDYGSQSCSGGSANQLVSDMSFQYIGSKTGYNPAFDGQIGRVQIYPHALDQEQVKKVMNSGAARIG